ncbi:MAG: VanW family protein [Anaerolineales bacterium]
MSFVTIPKPQRSPVPLQILTVMAGSLFLFTLIIGLISGGYNLLFSDRIFPGISMAGVDLTNMTPVQATSALSQHLTYPTSGRVVFRYGDKVWVATPAELGMVFDAGSSIQLAYGVGRQGGLFNALAGQLNAWQGGLELKPIIMYDERVAHGYIQNIGAQIDQPVIETDLHLNGSEVVYTQGQTGRLLNVDATMANLLTQLSSFWDGDVQMIVEEQAPVVADASAQADSLRQILSTPLTLRIDNPLSGDPGPWTIDPDTLAGMLTLVPMEIDGSWQYQVAVDAHGLTEFLGGIDNPGSNTRQLLLEVPAQVGRELDIEATIQAVQTGLLAGEHNIPLTVATANPAVGDDATAASLGITTLVSSNTSYFRGSNGARLQNIQAAAARFHGLLIPPNTTFSMGTAMGDISLENGYAEALIIYNGQSITGVGGGVCQVSTTLFRTAYFGGYPIVERHEHAYRVYYYEQTRNGTDPNLAGLDATVYFPLVDLKFTNDRPYWLLMETYFNAANDSLTWKFYSGDDGRTVDVHNLGLQNVVPVPDPTYEENPALAAGEISSADWWVTDGADITVTRTITRDGQQLYPTDTTQTHYVPHGEVCQYGPGTEDPEALAAQLGLCMP